MRQAPILSILFLVMNRSMREKYAVNDAHDPNNLVLNEDMKTSAPQLMRFVLISPLRQSI